MSHQVVMTTAAHAHQPVYTVVMIMQLRPREG